MEAGKTRYVLTTLGVVGAIVFVIALLASGSLALALALGWVMKHLFSFDMFHGTALALVAVVAGEVIVLKVMRSSDSAATEGVDVDDAYDDDEIAPPPAPIPRSVLRDVVAIVDRDGLDRDGGGKRRGSRRGRRH